MPPQSPAVGLAQLPPEHLLPEMILTDGLVYDPIGGSDGATASADILIANGRIAAIGPGLAAQWPQAQRLDCRGAIVVPGLVNGHTHSTEALAAGYCDGMRLEGWLDAVWGRLDALSESELRLSVLATARDLLRSGCVAVVDHFRQTPIRLEAIALARDCYREAGLQVTLAVMARDRVGGDGRLIGAPTGGTPLAANEIAAQWEEAIALGDPAQGYRIVPGPSGPTRCSDDLMVRAADLAARHDLPWHMHLAETRHEQQTALAQYGCPAAVHLARLGVLSSRASFAHAIWIDAGEIAALAEAGVATVHNPISNMALGSGIAAVGAQRAAGIAVAVGTDGAASNGGQDLLESLKAAALLQRATGAQPSHTWPSARDVLVMAVASGRRAAGLPGDGRLTPGAAADIAVFEARPAVLGAFADPARMLVYGRPPARHVISRGRAVLRDRAVVGFDEAALDAELAQLHTFTSTPTHSRRIDR